MDAKQVNNAEGNQDGFAISTLKKILKKEGTTMGLVSVNCVTGDYRFGGYVETEDTSRKRRTIRFHLSFLSRS